MQVQHAAYRLTEQAPESHPTFGEKPRLSSYPLVFHHPIHYNSSFCNPYIYLLFINKKQLYSSLHQQMRLPLFTLEAVMRAPTICPNTALLTVKGTSHIPKPKNLRNKKINGIDICTAKNHDFENLRHLTRHCPKATFIRNAVINTINTSSKLHFTSSTKNIIHTC
jgi:hypothetical protein